MSTRVVVEWTRATVRVAVATRVKGRWLIRAVRRETIGAAGPSPEGLRTLLGQVVGRHRPTQVVCVVPREQVITRIVKFPSVQSEELASMVELYARAQLPYAREQVVMEFYVLSQQDGFSTAAIVACQRDVIDRQLSLLQEAGYPASLLTVSSWGVAEWYRLLARSIPADAVPVEPCLVINLDDTRTDLVLVDRHRVASSRSVGQGVRDWSASAEVIELLAREVERSRAALRKELPGTDVRSIVLTGCQSVQAVGEPLAQRLGLPVQTVSALQPLAGVAPTTVDDCSPVVVGALAISPLDVVLNLNPPELRVQVSHHRQVNELVTVSLLLVSVLVLGAGALGVSVMRQRRAIARVDAVVAEMEASAKQVREQVRRIQLVESIVGDRRRLAGLLAGVFQATPLSVAFEVVSVERAKRQIVLRGQAPSSQAVLEYLDQLEGLDGIEEIQLKHATRRATVGGDRADFELILRVPSVDRAATKKQGA